MKWGFRDWCELEEWEIQEGGGTMWKGGGQEGWQSRLSGAGWKGCREGKTRAPGMMEVFWEHDNMMCHCILGI